CSLFNVAVAPRALHSFPTRRSSDLGARLSDRGSAGAPPGGRRRRPRDPGRRVLRAAGSRVPGPAGPAVPGAGGRRLPLYASPGRLLCTGGLLGRLRAAGRRVLLLADEGDRRGAGAGLELFQPPGAGPAAGAVRVL